MPATRSRDLIATNAVDGVIIGKAYYEGTIDLPKMFKLLS